MVGVGVLVNPDIKKIAIRHHRDSVFHRQGPVAFRQLVSTVNDMGAALLSEDSNDTTCCEALSNLLTLVREGQKMKGKVLFEHDGVDAVNPCLLAIAVFAALNGDLFVNLISGVFVEGAGYGGSLKLLDRLVAMLAKESSAAGDIFGVVVNEVAGSFCRALDKKMSSFRLK